LKKGFQDNLVQVLSNTWKKNRKK